MDVGALGGFISVLVVIGAIFIAVLPLLFFSRCAANTTKIVKLLERMLEIKK